MAMIDQALTVKVAQIITLWYFISSNQLFFLFSPFSIHTFYSKEG